MKTKARWLGTLLALVLVVAVAGSAMLPELVTAQTGRTRMGWVIADKLTVNSDADIGDDLTITDDVVVGGDLAVTGSTTGYVPLQVITDDGAITVANNVVLLNKGSAIAATLAAPTSAQDGMIVYISSMTAQAHTITATTIGFNALNAAGDVCTLGGAINDGIIIVASGGEWWILVNTNCTLG